jgi:hypothetical protein
MKSNHLKSYKAIIERSKDAYWAFIPELEGVSGVGETVQEAKQSMLEGLSLQQELGNLSKQEYIITYHFDRSSGLDLDTKTEITSPRNIGPLGFFHRGNINKAKPHLIWSQDNTGYGVESCLIDLTQFGANDLVSAECSAVWYSNRLSGDMSLDVKAYEGGTMSLSNFQWSNTGGRQTAETSFEGNVKNTGQKVNLLEQVGKITYDKRKKKLTFEPALTSH